MPALMPPSVASVTDNAEQGEWRHKAPTSSLVEQRLRERFEAVVELVAHGPLPGTFHDVERVLLPLVFTLGRLLRCSWLGGMKTSKCRNTRVLVANGCGVARPRDVYPVG